MTQLKSPKLQINKEIRWKLVEEVAALLEKAISPNAKVEHNVSLPVIGESRTRQCDVVITYGEPPRQSVAIVEVQRRQAKPDINTFHGWYHKMQEVGAQQLICVSMQGYPKSIIEDVANRIGPTVRLLTLAQLGETKVPGIEFIPPYVVHKHPHFTIETIGPGVHIKRNQLDDRRETFGLTLPTDEKVFTLDNSQEMQSLNELIATAFKNEIDQMFLQMRINQPNSYSLEITLGSQERDLWWYLDGQQHKVVSMPIKLSVETTVYRTPLTFLSYQQENIDGVLAWVAVAKGIIENKDISIQLVFKPDKEGFLQFVLIRQLGIERLNLFLSADKAAIEALSADDFSHAK